MGIKASASLALAFCWPVKFTKHRSHTQPVRIAKTVDEPHWRAQIAKYVAMKTCLAPIALGRRYNRATMPIRVFSFLLTFMLLWSGFTQPDPAAAATMYNIERQVHGELSYQCHAESIDHVQADEPPAQLHGEAALDPLLLKAVWEALEPGLTLERPHRFGLAASGAPFLEALQRPPCCASTRI